MFYFVLGFIKQVCNKSLTTDQAAWYPDLPDSCKNGLLISDKLYFMVIIEILGTNYIL